MSHTRKSYPTPNHRHVDDPHKALATAIIMQAIHDKRKRRAEVISFFQSDWFELLADLALVDPGLIRVKLSIPKCRARKIMAA